jgi:hypothetical protein
MRKYKSAIYKHLHGEFKDMFAYGDISAERLAEFEKDCFKDAPAAAGRCLAPCLQALEPPGAAAQSNNLLRIT